MNRSFENIFEKYNITCGVPRKRNRTPRLLTQPQQSCKNGLNFSKVSIMQRNGAENLLSSGQSPKKIYKIDSSYIFNYNSKGKYNNPTRYKTLDVIGLHSNLNCSIRERLPLLDNINICNDDQMSYGYGEANLNVNENRAIADFSTNIDIDCPKNKSSNSLNITNTKNTYKNRHYQQLKLLPVERRKSFNASFAKETKLKSIANETANFYSDLYKPIKNSIILPPKLIDTQSAIKQPVDNTSTELDLLIDLIEQEENKKIKEEYKQNGKCSNCDNLRPSKSHLKGGYEELFERALKREKVKSNFLKHDKKIGLRTGQLLTVVEIETFYGLTLATVKSKDLNKNFAIAIPQEMNSRMKLGAQIEAFFDDITFPYKLQVNDEWLDLYLEPYKILMV